MMGRRRALAVLGGAALFAGCPAIVRAKCKEITFCGFGNPREVAALQEVFALFEQENPDLRVRFIHVPQSYDSVIVTMIAGRRAPDVFYIGPWTLGSLLSKRVLLPIEHYLRASSVLRIEDFYPETVTPYRFDGTAFGQGPLYGLCKDWSPDYLLFYNKQHFAEAGLPLPDGGWTRGEFAETARRLTQWDARGRAKRFGVFNNCSPEQWVRQSGGSFFSVDGASCSLDSDGALDGLRYSADLSLRWKAAPGYGEQQQGAPNVMFEAGRAAMCFYGMWMVYNFQKKLPQSSWGVALPPRDRDEIYLSTAMIGYGISSATRHPDEAWRLFEFLLSPPIQGRFARLGWNIPSNRAVACGPDFLGNPALDTGVVETFLKAADRTVLFQRSPYIEPETFHRLFKPEWDDVLIGRRDVRSAMARVIVQVNDTIARNRKDA